MKRLSLLTCITLTLLVLMGAGLHTAAAQSAAWTVEYFNNPSLAGAPVVVQTVGAPGGNWGHGSPAHGIPVDNWSARWTTTNYVPGGNYQITVRADDGVRIIVDGIVYLDQYRPATGQTYQVALTLAEGNHTFVVDYYEAYEVAFLEYGFMQVGIPGPTLTPPVGGASVTVTAYTLNVRAQPNAWATILTRIYQGQSYPAIGRNVDLSWVQINVGGTIGWVNRSYVNGFGLEGLPITDGGGGTIPTPTPIPPPGGAYATVTAYALNVRNAPNPYTGTILTRISRDQTYPAIGRNADTSWVQLNVNGIIGWVSRAYITGHSFELLPITDHTTPPPPVNSYATVLAYFLNVRSTPSPYAPILTVIARGQTYPVVGRNAAATWIQVNVNGTIGWVNRGWVSVTNLSVPITG